MNWQHPHIRQIMEKCKTDLNKLGTPYPSNSGRLQKDLNNSQPPYPSNRGQLQNTPKQIGNPHIPQVADMCGHSAVSAANMAMAHHSV